MGDATGFCYRCAGSSTVIPCSSIEGVSLRRPSPIRTLWIPSVLVWAAASAAPAQSTLLFADKTIPFEEGFRIYLVPDMEGMGSAVQVSEVIAGNEAPRYRDRTGPDYWNHYRQLLTQEANAVIEGARAAGAQSFVVNEGHGGNRFANVIPWELDSDALLIRGYPKPMVMSTGIDATFGTMMLTGAHAAPPNHAVMSHNYAFDEFTVNGKHLNEVGINALIGGAKGVSVSLVSGDDVTGGGNQSHIGERSHRCGDEGGGGPQCGYHL